MPATENLGKMRMIDKGGETRGPDICGLGAILQTSNNN